MDDGPYAQRRVQLAFAGSAIELTPDGLPRTIDVPLGALALINPDVRTDDVTPYVVVAGGKEHVGEPVRPLRGVDKVLTPEGYGW